MDTLASTNYSEFSVNALEFAKWLTSAAASGFGPLSPADKLAEEYLIDQSYTNNDERVDSLIKWESAKNFTCGFLSGLGGVINKPFSISAEIASAFLVQARMVTAIAIIYGHNAEEEKIKTAVLLAICGQGATEVLKKYGVKIAEELTRLVIEQLTEELCKKISQAAGEYLLKKAAKETLATLIPLVGGVVRGSFNAASCVASGKTAKTLFR